jgi:predicted ATP-binding protein involved in virulence
MEQTKNNYRIHKIRMINFHNFTNETITINNGGHLFLLGDNGSGKSNRSRGIQSVSSLFSKNVFMCVSHSCRVSSLGGRMSSQDQPGIPSSGVPGISA